MGRKGERLKQGEKGGDKLIVKERKEERLYIYSWIWLSDSVSIFG
jgi:hypothetical protein